ncbi:glycosidase [Yersinia similis]|uniref:beta-glucosidase n=1 Tax=Yersinia similis TaxID=367190 RepID=A0ABM5PVJ6_9GAMM|nr:glycoside hydrolase family 3 N-terminal domain-containing protein [Yersinia similis]AHK18691.1 glycosidase [Yersinia similis]CFQ68740.1 putative glycosyl hydrolase [Yersinia similis]CNB84137.1 putative glycosyl hydrolase [Yersinia similis]
MSTVYRDATLPIEARIDDLLSQMTLAEKVGQLCQQPMLDYQQHRDDYLAGVRAGRWGSRILADTAWAGNAPGENVDPCQLNEIQRAAVEHSRLGIPLLFARDVIYGQATVLPIPLAQAASWNPELVQQAYRVIAREAASLGIHWTFAPMLDIARDPRWGRTIETSGEDPWLTAQFAAAVVKGFQGDDLSAADSLMACAKHFVGYAAVEGGRDYDTTELSDNTLHNVHLPPFQAAIEAGVGSVMTGFCDLGGTPVTAHGELIRGWLKQQQNFDGLVISDWGSIADLTHFGIAQDALRAAELALQAGVDMAMTHEAYEGKLDQLVLQGRINEALLDDAVRRVLRAKFRCGLFERPYVDEEWHKRELRRPEHLALAQRLAEQSIVLLKNRQALLPISRTSVPLTLAVIGPHAHSQRQHLGSWCLDGDADHVMSIYQSLCAIAGEVKVITEQSSFSDEMIECAHRADIVILCTGESHRRTGEARNIAELQLPPGQEELIAAVGRIGKPLVVIQCTGRPLPSPATEQYADALLYGWQCGSEAGKAIARIIFGEHVPCGKLPMTVPRSTGQIPIYYGRKPLGKMRDYREYQPYKDLADTPLYPFGFGLSYTRFTYSDLQLSHKSLELGASLRVTITVTNDGAVAGDEVVQCYIRQYVASTTRPQRELKGFQRISLQPGEAGEVSFTLGVSELAFYGQHRRYAQEPSRISVFVGGDSTTPHQADFTLFENLYAV